MKRKVLSVVAVLAVSFAVVAMAARYEELIIGYLRCTAISDQNGGSTSTPAQIVTARTAANTALQPSTFAQVDTNETTTATAYTPAYVGQILVGGAGEGTNGVWIAAGLTTNDWVVAAP
jgi:hypothetical protein